MQEKNYPSDFENQLSSSGYTLSVCTVARRRNFNSLVLGNIGFIRLNILAQVQVSVVKCWSSGIQAKRSIQILLIR